MNGHDVRDRDLLGQGPGVHPSVEAEAAHPEDPPLVAITAGATLAGIIGAFVAVPLTAVVVVVASEVRSQPG